MLVFEDDDSIEQNIEPVSLVAASGNIENRLLAYQKIFVQALLANFDKRLKIRRVAVLLRAIFDFRRIHASEGHSGCTREAAGVG